MLRNYFLWSEHAQKGLCGSHDPVHLVFGTIWWEMLKIVYPLIASHYITLLQFVYMMTAFSAMFWKTAKFVVHLLQHIQSHLLKDIHLYTFFKIHF